MSMKFAPLIDPAVRKPAPKPVRVDLRKVFAIGTGLWIVADWCLNWRTKA